MSPLSVSQYLDSIRLQFDLVIFDEASQVLPQDAIGAIYRGQQVVVAGDSKQMPPTQFFRSGSGDDAEGDEDDGPLESILDQCIAIGLNESTLRWHYRSRNEDLIAFSNHHFYGGRLVTFPSPTIDAPDRGVKFLHVQDGVYDRGGNRTNRIEARRVADLVMAHAEQGSEKSLGVIAFSMNQMLAILEELDTRRRARPNLETFFREDRREPFFVKNLETVQGDERDIIFFSVGYGKDRVGKMAASFGPLNQEGGERRLNVAVTRAREHVKLVSSILPADIDIQGTRSQGVRLLRQYMDYAMNGVQTLDAGPATSQGAAESPFEDSVAMELQRHGLIIHHQIGCAGFRIDLAVVDRNHPGEYIMGIECDGATYHSSKTARDRDRLRQEVLEGLGWRIHRIWSADWIKDPQGQVQRALLALEQAYQALLLGANRVRPLPRRETRIAPEIEPSDTDPAVRTASVSTISDATNEGASSARSQVQPYQEASVRRQSNVEAFYDSPREAATIGQLIGSIVQQEGPVSVDRVIEWVARCYGFERTGQRIVDRIDRVLTSAARRKIVLRRGDFLWDSGMDEATIPVRRLGPGGKQRAINRIAPEELGRAVILVLQEAFSLPEQDLIIQTARLLGFERTGSIIVDRLSDIVDSMHKQGAITKVAGYVSRASATNGLAKTP